MGKRKNNEWRKSIDLVLRRQLPKEKKPVFFFYNFLDQKNKIYSRNLNESTKGYSYSDRKYKMYQLVITCYVLFKSACSLICLLNLNSDF